MQFRSFVCLTVTCTLVHFSARSRFQFSVQLNSTQRNIADEDFIWNGFALVSDSYLWLPWLPVATEWIANNTSDWLLSCSQHFYIRYLLSHFKGISACFFYSSFTEMSIVQAKSHAIAAVFLSLFLAFSLFISAHWRYESFEFSKLIIRFAYWMPIISVYSRFANIFQSRSSTTSAHFVSMLNSD